jgi:1-acyl-sn-glycerol-3-phosphate acyltransferase
MPDTASPSAVRVFRHALEPLRRYHRYQAFGLNNIPRAGGALLAVHHSFATYDGFLLGAAVFDATGRLPTALGDNLLFRLPLIARACRESGIHPASPAEGERLLRNGHLLCVAPGGMREALRPSTEKYKVCWDKRRGFARLALRAGVPIIPAACPAADDVFRLYDNPITKIAYRKMKMPIPMARGVGLTALPRPVALVHYVGEPIQPPPWSPESEDEQVDALHARAVSAITELLTHHR